MSLVRWNPWRELEDVQGRLNQLLGETGFSRASGNASSLSEWSPAVDVQETDKEYLVKADLPDISRDDVKVQVVDGALVIEGERRQEKEHGKRFHKIEREYGRFLRRFTLPTEVDAGKVQAEFKNGVLNVHLPKTESARPKAIEVKAS
jgi:HSP20 family protein